MSTPCVGVLEAAYPPEIEVESKRYHYKPCPLDVKPPIPVNVFLHAFFNPDAHTFQFFLNRLPKKLKKQLSCGESREVSMSEMSIGWGVHIIEGLNWFLVTCLVISLVICTGLFALVWSISRQAVLQEGFGIGQYLVAAIAVVMTALITKWTSKSV